MKEVLIVGPRLCMARPSQLCQPMSHLECISSVAESLGIGLHKGVSNWQIAVALGLNGA